MKKIIKPILTILLIIAMCALIWYMVPGLKDILTKEGQVAFKERIEELGIWGFLLLFFLQVMQIMLVVLPGEPLEVLAGMCYGTWCGVLFITFSVFVTTTVIFFIVRKYGKKYLYNFFEKEKVDKLEKKLLKHKKKMEIILWILFFLPGTPKDLALYIGGLLPIKPLRFILISTFVRFPSVISSTMVGSNLVDGKWETSLIIYGVVAMLTGIALFIVHKKDKKKEIIDILK